MGEQAIQLLQDFEALPNADKQSFLVEILRRTREFPLDSGALTDQEIGEAGRSLSAFLDQEPECAAR